MVSVNDSYAGNHLAAADLKGRECRLTVASVSMEKLGDDHKLVAYFRGTEKDLVLNKTNANAIAEMYGDETELWTGRDIVIFPTQTDFGGKIVPCIRVKLMAPVEAGVPGVQAPAPLPPVANTGMGQAPEHTTGALQSENPAVTVSGLPEVNEDIPWR